MKKRLEHRVSVTNAVQFNKEYRLYRGILSRSQRIEWQIENNKELPEDIVLHAEVNIKLLKQLKERLTRLVSNNIITPVPDAQYNNSYLKIYRIFHNHGSTRDHLESIFGDNLKTITRETCQLREQFYYDLRLLNLNARQQEQNTLFTWEMSYRLKQGYYPVFNTLTVTNEYIDKVFKKGSRCFSTYIKSINRLVGKHPYFAVTEIGDRHGRLHIHVMHLLPRLPEGAADPNVGRSLPDRRELVCLKGKWKYGLSAPMIFRYSEDDPWGKLGYRWPLGEDGEPIEAGSWIRGAGYMSKYISKSYATLKRPIKCRTKKSRGVGLTQLRKAINQQPLSTLMTLVITPIKTDLKILNRRMPSQLVHKEAQRNLMQRLKNSDKRKLKIPKSLMELKAQSSLAQRLTDLTRKNMKRHNSQNITDIRTEKSQNTAISNLVATMSTIVDKECLPVSDRFSKIKGSSIGV